MSKSSIKRKTIITIILTVVGIGVVIVGFLIPDEILKSLTLVIGSSVVGAGIAYLFTRSVGAINNVAFSSTSSIMKKEKLIEIAKDLDRGKELIYQYLSGWASSRKAEVIRIKGVSLNLIFARQNGLLSAILRDDKLVNPERKKMQVLLLNPFSTNAIMRSISESDDYDVDKDTDPVSTICKHNRDVHKKKNLYKDFIETANNIENLMRRPDLNISCRIYSIVSPNFLLIRRKNAIIESLVQGKLGKKDKEKLYGKLPKFVYGNGGIRDSLRRHFDYIWKYCSVPLEDFHYRVEEDHYVINRLFLLYNYQKDVWERQWSEIQRSLESKFCELYNLYTKLRTDNPEPESILELGCGDAGGGTIELIQKHKEAKFTFVDISKSAIELLRTQLKAAGVIDMNRMGFIDSDMLTYLQNNSEARYSVVYANFSIIYMTSIKAWEIFRLIYNNLEINGVFVFSVWTKNYFLMPIGEHGIENKRPPHVFMDVPMSENLKIIINEGNREGEIRRYYDDINELRAELQKADKDNVMDFEHLHIETDLEHAIIRVFLKKNRGVSGNIRVATV